MGLKAVIHDGAHTRTDQPRRMFQIQHAFYGAKLHVPSYSNIIHTCAQLHSFSISAAGHSMPQRARKEAEKREPREGELGGAGLCRHFASPEWHNG